MEDQTVRVRVDVEFETNANQFFMDIRSVLDKTLQVLYPKVFRDGKFGDLETVTASGCAHTDDISFDFSIEMDAGDLMPVEIDDQYQDQIEKHSDTSRLRCFMTLENCAGSWMYIGDADNPSEIGEAILNELKSCRREAQLSSQTDEEADRLLIRYEMLSDAEVSELGEFPGW